MSNPNNKLQVTSRQYAEYFKFTVVRNPWDRAVSWYENVIRDEVHLRNLKIDADISFREFMSRFGGTGGLRPQLFWLRDFDGHVPMDVIARFESLEEDWRIIARRLGLPNASLPHVLKGSKPDYRDYYDRGTREMVAELYKEEIELFAYGF